MTSLRASTSLAAAVVLLGTSGCGGFGGGGGDGGGGTPGPPATLTGSVTPTVTPSGTAGANIGATAIDGTVIKGAAVIGESVRTQDATATSPSGTVLQVRHGFFPGNQPTVPSGPG